MRTVNPTTPSRYPRERTTISRSPPGLSVCRRPRHCTPPHTSGFAASCRQNGSGFYLTSSTNP